MFLEMKYTAAEVEVMFRKIEKAIGQGSSLRSACKLDGTPTMETFYRWLERDAEYAKRYARAVELRNEVKFESIEADYSEEPQRDAESGRIDPAWVQLQRLKIDAKKWELSKLQPTKYGDKLDVTSGNKALAVPAIVGMVIKNEVIPEVDEYDNLD